MKRKTPSQNHSERAFSDAKFMLSELDPQDLVRPVDLDGRLSLARQHPFEPRIHLVGDSRYAPVRVDALEQCRYLLHRIFLSPDTVP